jgi:hypothetical protein
LILNICLIVAVFQTAGATKKTAQEVTKLRFLTESYYNTLGVNLTANPNTSEVNLTSNQPPCKQCLKKGKTVEMVMGSGHWLCPKCLGTRGLK